MDNPIPQTDLAGTPTECVSVATKNTPATAGDHAPGVSPSEEDKAICPLCGGRVQRVEVTSVSGERAYSSCCNIPQEFLDNWDTFSDLPEDLQRIAIEKRKAEYAAMTLQDSEVARRFRERVIEWDAAEGAELRREYNADQG